MGARGFGVLPKRAPAALRGPLPKRMMHLLPDAAQPMPSSDHLAAALSNRWARTLPCRLSV